MRRDEPIETAASEWQLGIGAGGLDIEGKNRDLLQKSFKLRHGIGASIKNPAPHFAIGNDGGRDGPSVASLKTTRRRATRVGQDVDEYVRIDQESGVSHA